VIDTLTVADITPRSAALDIARHAEHLAHALSVGQGVGVCTAEQADDFAELLDILACHARGIARQHRKVSTRAGTTLVGVVDLLRKVGRPVTSAQLCELVPERRRDTVRTALGRARIRGDVVRRGKRGAYLWELSPRLGGHDAR
jgi:hypothetical protein